MSDGYSEPVWHDATNAYYMLDKINNIVYRCEASGKDWERCKYYPNDVIFEETEDPDVESFMVDSKWDATKTEAATNQTLETEDLIPAAQEIRNKLKNDIPYEKFNILIVGLPGVGKSSLVNSMLMAINPRGYQELSQRGYYGKGGKGGRAAVTLQLQKTHMFKFIEPGEAGKERSYKCQPYIWDLPGLPDVDDKNITTILRMVLNGEMKTGKTLTSLLEMGEDKLAKLAKWKPSKTIQAVIFVHAADDPVPENLLDAVRNALNPDIDGATGIPTFAVITKEDMMDNEKRKYLPKIKQELAEHLGLGGLSERVYVTSLYCDSVTPDLDRSQTVDAAMCKLWKQLLKPEIFMRQKKTSFLGALRKNAGI